METDAAFSGETYESNQNASVMKKMFWIVVAVFCVSIAFNVWQWRNQPEPSVVVKMDTVWKDTTIREPVATETIQTERVLYITVAVPQTQAQPDTVHDSIEVPVPIVQKRYDDSLYTAWVSGFEPNLDSIRLHQREILTTVTKTIVKHSPRLSVGVQAGAGVGVFSRQPDVYVGVGIQYRL